MKKGRSVSPGVLDIGVSQAEPSGLLNPDKGAVSLIRRYPSIASNGIERLSEQSLKQNWDDVQRMGAQEQFEGAQGQNGG